MAEGDQLRQADFRGEADLTEIRAVHTQEQGGSRPDGFLVVAQMRAVGGADLDQPGSAGSQDVRNAEAAADLDKLAARDDHLAVARQGHQAEQDGRGVVVDHQRVLGAGQAAQQIHRVDVARAALAGIQVVLQVAVAAAGHLHGRLRGVAERRPAQVGVDQHPGGVDNGAQRGTGHRFEAG